ncbi:type IV pili methyl-accepting chemotaxis transducer N-terminal domain-containing protein [Desulforhopalus sp. 52FAK]
MKKHIHPFCSLVTFALLCSLLLGLPVSCFAAKGPTAAEYGVVLNLSGKQRMLTQKMSKEVLLIARNNDVENNLKSLEATASLFDKTLVGLIDGDKDLNLPPTVDFLIKMQLGKVQLLWANFYPPIQEIIKNKTVTDHQAWQIAEKNLQLLKEAAACVTMYEKDAAKAGLKSNPNLAVSINLSGKQRMLSQKMSKEYLLIAYGHKIADNQKRLKNTYSLFERTLLGLINGDEGLNLMKTTNEVTANQLYVIMDLWKTFKPLVVAAAEIGPSAITQEQISLLSRENLLLLKEMNKAVSMYEKEAAKSV